MAVKFPTNAPTTPNAPIEALVERLRDSCLDWDRTEMASNATTRVDLTCGEVRQAADALEALSAERDALDALLVKSRAALNRMMDAWLDYHDAHSLTQPVTGAAGNAFEDALEARDAIDAALGASPKQGEAK